MTPDQQDPCELVSGFFADLRRGDVDSALARWAPGAVWHLQGEHAWAGDHLVPHYVGLLGRWAQEHPQYAPEVQGPQRWGQHFVVTAVRSTGGEAPGVAEGLLVHRVQDGLLQEGWGLPADPRSPF